MDMRIMIHAILGTFIYGIFGAKFLLLRVDRAPGWILPILGSALGVERVDRVVPRDEDL
jgi:Family of unknown function (DUF6529)